MSRPGSRGCGGAHTRGRAYTAWLDTLFERGMRVDYSLLGRLSLQPTSDQTDPVRYVPISAAAPTCLAPEQSAVWAYPQPDWSAEVNVAAAGRTRWHWTCGLCGGARSKS